MASINCGVSTATLYPQYTDDALLFLCKNGVKLVEVFANTDTEISLDFALGMKKVADEYGVKITSLHPFTCGLEPFMFFTPYERRAEDFIEYYKKYFETANILGADYFVFHGDKKNSAFPKERYFERYEKLYDAGKSAGITVLQENVGRCRSGKLKFLLEMKQALGDKASFVLDTKQSVRGGENPYKMVRALGSSIKHIHISDSGEKGDCLLVGAGNLNFERFCGELAQIDYNGAVMLELYDFSFGEPVEVIENYGLIKSIAEKF